MRSKLFWAGVLVCLAATCSLGQDPTKVEPKHYKRDFENEHVDVVSVHYGPHEKSVLHDHPGGGPSRIEKAVSAWVRREPGLEWPGSGARGRIVRGPKIR